MKKKKQDYTPYISIIVIVAIVVVVLLVINSNQSNLAGEGSRLSVKSFVTNSCVDSDGGINKYQLGETKGPLRYNNTIVKRLIIVELMIVKLGGLQNIIVLMG